ncbi:MULTISPECIES: cytochrome bd oxidase small subunit CydS [Paenibacillus]
MEHFIIMIAPELVIVAAIVFLFVYAAKSKPRADELE